MKLQEKYRKNSFTTKGLLFALGLSIIWPLLSWLIFYLLDYIRIFIENFRIIGGISYFIDFINIQIFFAPFYIEVNYFTVFKLWIVVRFIIFAGFGYYNGIIYKKLSSKFKENNYFVITSFLFYYIVITLIRLIGILFFGGLP